MKAQSERSRRRATNRISVSDRTGRAGPDAPWLQLLLRNTMRELRLRDAEVSLVLVSDPFIRRLNRKYRRIDRPTDVLSFQQNDPPLASTSGLLGDIVISRTTARQQAIRASHSLRRELALLTIHGLLHLLGFDHAVPRDAKRMFGLQDRLLARAFRG